MFIILFIIFTLIAGRNQVAVGIVPVGVSSSTVGSQSSLSVYPLAIANCKEER